ncbi:MAG: ArsC family reductase [Cellvibrionaceae bacterium]|nr:ArsC family reductase [Cellvibrionaceae bacterium]
MMTLFGIKNCDTVKKARRWLDARSIAYEFHDFRENGLDRIQLMQWLDELGWETLINKRSTSWKALDDTTKSTLNQDNVIPLILKTPTLIKRPLLDTGKGRHLGFNAEAYQQLLTP